MKVTLYKAFPDIFRQSMQLYVDELSVALKSQLAASDQVKVYLPNGMVLKPALLRYWSQYVRYQLEASRNQGDINHILDHAYGHLVHTLDPKRTVVTFHDAIRFKGTEGQNWTRQNLVQRYSLSGTCKAAWVIFDSEAGRHDFLKMTNYPAEKTSIIPFGVNDCFFNESSTDSKKEFNLGEEPHFLHVGHTGDYKNIPALFHVLAKLKKQGSPVRLLKTGTEFTSKQKSLAKELNVESSITHLGMVTREKISNVYRAADAFLFPSYDEGFGIPVLEAMASGLPVICSNRGSLPEVVGDAGVVTEPEDYEGMATAVSDILKSTQKREELIRRGKERAKNFTWERAASETLKIYKRILEKNS